MQNVAGSEGATHGSPPALSCSGAQCGQAPVCAWPALGRSGLDNSSPTRVELSAPTTLTDTGGQSCPLWARRALKNGSLFGLNSPNFCVSFLCLSTGLGSCMLLGDCQLPHPLFSHSGKQFVPQEDLEQNMKPFCFIKIRRKENGSLTWDFPVRPPLQEPHLMTGCELVAETLSSPCVGRPLAALRGSPAA